MQAAGEDDGARAGITVEIGIQKLVLEAVTGHQ